LHSKVSQFDPRLTRTDGHLDLRYCLRQPRRAAQQAWDWLCHGAAPLAMEEAVLPAPARDILRRFAEDEENARCTDKHSYGGHRQSTRVAALAEWSVGEFPGDIVEVGSCSGVTTRLLAPIAQKAGRRVIAIDPWITGTQNCDGGEYETFLKNIEPWKDVVDVWRVSSLEAATAERLRTRPLAFAFVDGLHTYDACTSDFALVGHTRGLIVGDDVRYNREVCLARRMAARRLGRRAVHLAQFREGYLTPP
jgi:predicted O-methyltransferase YrrM